MLEGLDTLFTLIAIGGAIMLWMMFTERNPTIAPHKSYHPQEYYGD